MSRLILARLIAGCATLAGCDATTTLTISIEGDGQGWVSLGTGVSTEDVICRRTCEIELGDAETSATISAGTTGALITSACPGSARSCELVVTRGQELTFRFEKDPHELITLFIDEAPLAVDFAPNGDLIVGTAMSLRRLSLDGTEIWRSPHELDPLASRSLFLRTGAQGLTAVGQGRGPLTAYREDGAPVWTFAAEYLSDVEVGPNDEVVVADGFGRILSLAAVNGRARFVGTGPLSKSGGQVAVDQTGLIAYVQYDPTEIFRFDATGQLTTWHSPTPLGKMMFDATAQLVAISAGGYTRFDDAGNATSIIAEGSRTDFGIHESGFFEWSHRQGMHALDAPVITTLDQSGSIIWQIEKPQTLPVSGACDRAGQHCVLVGHYTDELPQGAPTEFRNWIEVFKLP